MLAVTDLGLSTSILPKKLSIFWFSSREIDFSACLIQMYFIHCFLEMESGIFVAMAVDHYRAICHPLRHSTILTNPVVIKISLAVVLRRSIFVLPYPLLASQWPYCRTNIIPHTYFEYMAVMNLACTDIHVSRYYGLFVLLSMIGVLYPDPQGHLQPFHKGHPAQDFWDLQLPPLCHLSLLHPSSPFLPHVPVWPHGVPAFPYSHCQSVPPMLNPIIYRVSTKQIWGRLLQTFTHKGN
ncbi:unnamed protein product [Caretta caretta]